MISAFVVKFKGPGFVIADLKRVNLPSRIILKNKISLVQDLPHPSLDRIVLKIGRQTRTFHGFLIVESESMTKKFLIKHAVMNSEELDVLLDSIRVPRSRMERYGYFNWRGRTYIYKLSESCSIIFDWNRGDKFLYPSMAGWFERNYKNVKYFYLHGIDDVTGRLNLRVVDKYNEIPEEIFKTFSPGYKIYLPGKGFIAVTPFPPFDVNFAVKLLPVSVLKNAKPLPIPADFQKPYILKTFVPVSRIPVMELPPNELRAIAENITGSVYDPNFPNPHWLSDYRFIKEQSCGYLLFATPRKIIVKENTWDLNLKNIS